MAVETGLEIQAYGVTYTVRTASSADHGDVAVSTRFYDIADDIIYFKDSGGIIVSLFETAGGGVFGISDATGEYTYYATLTLAFAASSAGDTVHQFADVLETTDITVIIPVDVNWDLNGFTYEKNAVGSTDHAVQTLASSTNYVTNGRINNYNGADGSGATIAGNINGIFYGWGLTVDNNKSTAFNNDILNTEVYGVTAFCSPVFGYACFYGGKYYNCKATNTTVGFAFYRPQSLFNCHGYAAGSHCVEGTNGAHYDQVHLTSGAGRGIDKASNNLITNSYIYTGNGVGIYATGTGCKISNTYIKSTMGNCIVGHTALISVEITNCRIEALTSYAINIGQDSLLHGNYISSVGYGAVLIEKRSVCTNNTIICAYNNVLGYGIRTINSTVGNECVISGNRISIVSTATNYIYSSNAASVEYSQNLGFGVSPTIPVNANITQAIVAIEDNQGNLFN